MRNRTESARRSISLLPLAILPLLAGDGERAPSPVASVSPAAPAAPAAQSFPCSGARHREFDFLLGDWEAYSPDGKLAGRDRITRILDGCALEEAWSDPASPPSYRGGSVSAFDARTGRWHQTWVDNQGVTSRLEGGRVETRMVLEGEAGAGPPGRRVRLTWEPLPTGEVRQTIERADAPDAWRTGVVFLYRRPAA